ncbi:hypothetical protein ABZP36_008755 [Zizania latifolia]
MLSCLFSGGQAECSLSDLVVTQTAVPGQVGGDPEYQVTVENRCICTQTDVKVSCAGFDSPLPVDPAVIRPDGDGSDLCTLNNGGAVTNDAKLSFTYAGKTEVSFAPVSSTVNCS